MRQPQIQSVNISNSRIKDLFHQVSPPVENLYIQSDNVDDLLARPRVAIVGSRKITAYGKAVTRHLSSELAGQGIVIVSGLAYGVDAVAHTAALEAGGLTIAVLPSSLEDIYPSAHNGLARRIISQGGALLTEYPPGTPAYKSQFVERNRIVSAVSCALLITEAAINSGTMHTARFALEQGKDVLAVPGNITSATSAGTNNLIKSGAIAVTETADVLRVLGLTPLARRQPAGATPQEQRILDLMTTTGNGDQLLSMSELSTPEFNQALTMLEITGKIVSLGANQWAVA